MALPPRFHPFGFAILSIVALSSCSADEGSLGRPSVGVGPVDPITLVFINPTDNDVYVDYPDIQPIFVLEKGGKELMTRRGCLPFCGDGCSCTHCNPTKTRIRRILAGESMTVSWDPVHYVTNSCMNSNDCQCVESWPITAGQYKLRISGFTDAVGGAVSAADPNVIEGAVPGDQSKACTGSSELEIRGGSFVVETNFVCP